MLWVWGGLRPIPSRTAVDLLTIASLFYCAASPADLTNGALLALVCLTTLATAGPSSRWTISFPLLPFAALQVLRWIGDYDASRAGVATGWLSFFLAAIAAALTVLFPAVELSPPPNGKFNVGVADLHLPVDFTEGVRRGSLLGTQHQDAAGPSRAYVAARVLYPTEDGPGRSPYLDPDSAGVICAELMKAGAPGPLRRFRWMLRAWEFATIGARRNAEPAPPSEGRDELPVAIFSHGLTGASATYAYQAMNLAAQGWAVLMVDHTDASAIAVRRRDGSHLLYDPSLVTALMSSKDNEEYERRRRAQTEHRVEECLAALKALGALNRRDIPELQSAGLSFIGRLDMNDVTAMGHSFGGATALALAAAAPDLITAVVAHEPAVSWMPDKARQGLLAPEGDATREEKKEDPAVDGGGGPKSIHDLDMLILYSEEWEEKGWGNCREIRGMVERGKLGRDGGASDVGVIGGAKHSDFSDAPMLMPLWLTRATGFTGERNPHDTAAEIAVRTVEFLRAAKR